MEQLNIPSASVLLDKYKVIRAIQELYQAVNTLSATPAQYVPSPFKSSWTTGATTSLSDFCDEVYNDPDTVVGRTYLGQLECTGLPDSLSNGEARIDVVQTGDSEKLLIITLYSLTTSPYHWEYTYPYGTTWRSWEVPTP